MPIQESIKFYFIIYYLSKGKSRMEIANIFDQNVSNICRTEVYIRSVFGINFLEAEERKSEKALAIIDFSRRIKYEFELFEEKLKTFEIEKGLAI